MMQTETTGKWHCIECNTYFDEPENRREVLVTDPPHDETFPVCPHCGAMDIERVVADE